MQVESEEDTHKAKVVETEKFTGNIWKCLPKNGQFCYLNVDFNGYGGFAQIIEEYYDPLKGLKLLNSLIGDQMQSIGIPITQEKGREIADKIKQII